MRGIRCKCSGFTLVEIMIAMVLLAILMAAVGAAVHASMMNFRENDEMFKAISTGRQALMRITTDLRTCSATLSSDPAGRCTIDLDGDPDDDEAVAGWDIAYQLDDATNTLNLIIDPDGAAESHVLCRNVTALTFTRVPATGKARNVRVSMTVTVGNHAQTVSSAAVIRRNL
ncbi:MAG: prepilin-type N-terminal cleavage/methylation domain-containing protein [Phycisphaerae bacterium]|nr:prepilin-type N-terminal cleavage/methylation domain-containing protein [Phycisphaerae bacterium]